MEVPPDADRPSAPSLVRYCYVLSIKRKISLLDFHILVLMADNNWNRKNLQSMRILTRTMRPGKHNFESVGYFRLQTLQLLVNFSPLRELVRQF